jgi:membrane protease YdiL (CAAX protease family)
VIAGSRSIWREVAGGKLQSSGLKEVIKLAMSMDPGYLPIDDAPADPAGAVSVEVFPPRSQTVPHLGHALLFGALVLLASILIGIGFALALLHLKPYVHETGEQMQTDPRFVIPLEAVMYAVAASASLLIFPLLWRRSFGEGVHFRAVVARHRWWLLAGIGVATSVVVQVLSIFLPIPKELPIDKFFTNPIGVWLVAIFGVTVAPAFEELAFRGFLLPSLASAWDWVAGRGVRERLLRHSNAAPAEPPTELAGYAVADYQAVGNDPAELGNPNPDPRWSLPALIFSSVITSIGFALLHGGQLAHSFAPLAVLFVVSLVLCITRLRFHSLAASTVVHSLYNATIFVMLFVGTDGFRHLDKLNK